MVTTMPDETQRLDELLAELRHLLPAAAPARPPSFVPGAATTPPPRKRGRPRVARPLCAYCQQQPVQARGRKFCSSECRSHAMREFSEYQDAIAKARAARDVNRTPTGSPELREAFKLLYRKQPMATWPDAERNAYLAYINGRRQAERERVQGESVAETEEVNC